MDFAILIGMYVFGMFAGGLIVLCWVPDAELQRHCDETEHGVGRVK